MTFFQQSQQGKVVWDNHWQFAKVTQQQFSNKVERELILNNNWQFARVMKWQLERNHHKTQSPENNR